jgi:RHS repeat-associated protein
VFARVLKTGVIEPETVSSGEYGDLRFSNEVVYKLGQAGTSLKSASAEAATDDRPGYLPGQPWRAYGSGPLLSFRRKGIRQYELTDHLGNVRAVIGDRLVETTDEDEQTAYAPQLLSATDYFPFGMQMPGRVVIEMPEGYRYGFNGMEKENAVNEDGYDFGARLLNTWNGKWLAVDPLFGIYPSLSPYVSMGNNPILIVDVDGRYIVVRGQDNQAEMLNVIKSSFSSDVAKDFSFNHQGVLQFSGNINDLKGLDKKLAKPLLKVMNAEYVVRVSFTKDSHTDDHGGAYARIDADNQRNIVGGAIRIDPAINTVYNEHDVQYYYTQAGGYTDKESEAKRIKGQYGEDYGPVEAGTKREKDYNNPIVTNKVSAFFHEIGHFAFFGKRKEKVISYENVARKTQDQSKRTIDAEHTGK